MDEYVTKLGLQVTGKGDVDALRQSQAALKGETFDLADSYEVMTSDLETARRALQKMDEATDPVTHALSDMEQKAIAAGNAVEHAGGKIAQTSKHTADFGRAGLIAGQGLQDIAQGGFPAILNQIDQMSLALGLSGGISGLLTAVGVAAYIATPLIKSFFAASDSDKIPKVTGDLGEMADAVKTVGEMMEEAKKHRWDSLENITKYNALVEVQAQLEKNITDEKKKQADWDKLKESKSKEEEEAAKGQSKVLKERLGGGENAEALARMVVGAMPSAGRDAKAADLALLNTEWERLNKLASEGEFYADSADGRRVQIQKELDRLDIEIEKQTAVVNEADRKRQTEARSVVTSAFAGDPEALARLQKAAEKTPGTEDIRKELGRATPAGQQQARDVWAEIEAGAKEELDAIKEEKDFNAKTERLMDQAESKMWSAIGKDTKERARAVRDEADAALQSQVDEAVEAKRESDRAAREAARVVTPERALQQQEAGIFQREAGATEGEAMGMAAISIKLQEAGMGAIQARQRAYQEQVYAMNGMTAMFNAMRAQDEQFAQGMREQQRTLLNRGGMGR